jgi:hypothetical protein
VVPVARSSISRVVAGVVGSPEAVGLPMGVTGADDGGGASDVGLEDFVPFRLFRGRPRGRLGRGTGG